MPLGGPAPKNDADRRRANKPTHEWVEVENVPFEGGPELPSLRANGDPWPDATLRLWEVWRRMPHAIIFSPEDWEYVFATLEVAASFHLSSAISAAAELRKREGFIGANWDARRALRIRYVEPKSDKPALAAVVNADDYRNL